MDTEVAHRSFRARGQIRHKAARDARREQRKGLQNKIKNVARARTHDGHRRAALARAVLAASRPSVGNMLWNQPTERSHETED